MDLGSHPGSLDSHCDSDFCRLPAPIPDGSYRNKGHRLRAATEPARISQPVPIAPLAVLECRSRAQRRLPLGVFFGQRGRAPSRHRGSSKFGIGEFDERHAADSADAERRASIQFQGLSALYGIEVASRLHAELRDESQLMDRLL